MIKLNFVYIPFLISCVKNLQETKKVKFKTFFDGPKTRMHESLNNASLGGDTKLVALNFPNGLSHKNFQLNSRIWELYFCFYQETISCFACSYVVGIEHKNKEIIVTWRSQRKLSMLKRWKLIKAIKVKCPLSNQCFSKILIFIRDSEKGYSFKIAENDIYQYKGNKISFSAQILRYTFLGTNVYYLNFHTYRHCQLTHWSVYIPDVKTVMKVWLDFPTNDVHNLWLIVNFREKVNLSIKMLQEVWPNFEVHGNVAFPF